MSLPTRISRRTLLTTGFQAAAACNLLADKSIAQSSSQPKAVVRAKTFYFLDWHHVRKGDLRVSLDPQRLSDSARTELDRIKREHQRTFETTGHGFTEVDVPYGIRIVQEKAVKSQPWLAADKPWEKRFGGIAAVIKDGGRFRCWYNTALPAQQTQLAMDDGRGMEIGGSGLGYAESDDGLQWVKPTLKQFSIAGNKDNNIVAPFGNGGAVFRDDHGPPAERYKLFEFAALPKDQLAANASARHKFGLFGVTSPDGLHWKLHSKPLIRYFCDTNNIAAWDPLLGKYVGYFRHHFSGRTISRAETLDFWKWPEPEPFAYAGPMDGPADDYYTNGYTAYPDEPSIRLLFPAIYHHDDDTVDVRLWVSRDGRIFQPVSHDPIISIGKAGDWDGGSIYAQPQLLRLPNGKLALPLDVHDTSHNEAWFQTFYRQYPGKTVAAWALWDEDRLAGIEAKQVGQFTLAPHRFEGSQIQVNAASARGGAVEVELRLRGKPIEGFAFADCVPMQGDLKWTPCRWKAKSNLSAIVGKTPDVVVRLRGAKIFALRFA